MSRVDVLAVMARDATAAWNDRRGDREIQEFLGKESNEARAAVAELIEAVDKLFGADMEHCMEMDGKDDQLEAVQFAKSALARVKGA
ncbi:hypothetical protein [Stenotrophomonas maltophilia]|uniref:hypothetical protein n=1 Tax=Stenotrophomonas maltophilia TaxID=40324 RepID=UPI00050A14C5|nr:hypothetical protein [Stenotrophomonas maltophilia]KGM25273.1 hypothetical protein LI87_0102360 [Stenotrophomonas maltophilia]